jgi:hypothetical protein
MAGAATRRVLLSVGTDEIKVIVARQLPQEVQYAPLHLFSASPELVGFGRDVYRMHSDTTSTLLKVLFDRFREEGFAMSYTMEDFKRDYLKEHLEKLPPDERREVLQSLPLEERLAGLSEEQIQHYLEQLRAVNPAKPRKTRGKK